jgi:hypothetical protein
MSISSISSVAASTPVKAPDPVQSSAPDVSTDDDTDDAGASQPPALPPLPPGQGPRIDQLA